METKQTTKATQDLKHIHDQEASFQNFVSSIWNSIYGIITQKMIFQYTQINICVSIFLCHEPTKKR